MAEISAADVMKLRKMSGQGMMDCKKALGETDGDVEKAMELLRKKGMATMAKRAEREASEGKIIFVETDESAALAMLCCETDFVAKSDDFNATLDTMAEYVKACDADSGSQALADTEVNGKKLSEVVTDLVAKTGEKTEVGDYVKFKKQGKNIIGSYIHFNGKSGAIVEIETDADDDGSLKTAANDVAMHATATKPLAVDRDGVDADVIAKERDIVAEQMKGKPANIIDQIVEGKMGKFFADNCLVDQKFVKNEDVTVGKMVAEAGKKLGGNAKVKNCVMLQIG